MTYLSSLFLCSVRGSDLSSLLSGLVAYWPMDEVNGTRQDVAGGYDLGEAAGVVGSNTGHVYSLAAEWLDDPDYLSISRDTVLSPAGAFTLNFWIYQLSWPDVSGQYHRIYSTGTGIFTPGMEVKTASNSRVAFILYPGGGNSGVTLHRTFSLTTWTMMTCWYDPTGPSWNAARNAGVTTSGAINAVVSGGTRNPYTVGEPQVDNCDFRLGPMTFWNRVLTADERTLLWNAGSGLQYPF